MTQEPDNQPPAMTGDEFQAWAERCGLTRDRQVMEALGGLPLMTVQNYKHGKRPVPRPVIRLCAFVERYGPDGWKRPRYQIKRPRMGQEGQE